MGTATSATTTTAAAARTAQDPEVDPVTVAGWLERGECVLVDVRQPDEHARERIAGARLVPLGTFDPQRLELGDARRVVFHCRAGARSADAAARAALLASRGIAVHSMKGGIERWKAAHLPVQVDAAAPRLGVMQQTQLVIGSMVLTGLALGWFVHPAGYLLSAMMGAGLTVAGLTGACPLAMVIARMPWNRSRGAACER